ncbi:EamA family transporter [soil metagenome]
MRAEEGAGVSSGGRATRRDRLIGLLLVVVSAGGFGSGALLAKPVYAAGVDWLTLSVWRFLFAAALSWLWLLAWPRTRRLALELSRPRLVALLALGVFFVGNTATYYAALETVPASLAALIVYIYPALVAVLSLRFGRRLEGRRPWFALVLATVGVALALGGIDPEGAPPVAGLVLAIASPIIYAVWIVLAAHLGGERRAARPFAKGTVLASDAERQTRREHPPASRPTLVADRTEPAPAAAVMMTATLAVYLLMGLAAGSTLDPRGIPTEAWLPMIGIGVVSTALAVQAFYAGARRIGAAQASLVSTVEPVYTIALATLLLNEVLTAVQLAGGALVILAVLLAQTGGQQESPVIPRRVPAEAGGA